MLTRLILLLTFYFLLSLQLLAQADTPEIGILGMFHFGETTDLAAIKMDRVLGEQRQAEIQALVDQLAAFGPEKVLVEYPMVRQERLQANYQKYLAGSFDLPKSETYQIGFRLAKQLGHELIYAVDYKLDLDFQSIIEYAQANDQSDQFAYLIEEIQEFTQGETNRLRRMTLSAYLASINAAKFDRMANSLYLGPLLEFGDTESEVGAKVAADWYLRNMLITRNIRTVLEEGDERLLLIIGSSHRAVMKDFIRDRQDMQYVEIQDYLLR